MLVGSGNPNNSEVLTFNGAQINVVRSISENRQCGGSILGLPDVH